MIPKVLIIIPAYNEGNTIRNVLQGLNYAAPDYDRVVVNDGSTDLTGKIVTDLGEKQIKLACNIGYGQAIQTGIKYALECNYDVVVTFDADGQHKPEYVTNLVDYLLKSDSGLVIGSRYSPIRPYSGPFSRKIGQIIFSIITRFLIGYRIYDTTSGFKAFRNTACHALQNQNFLDFHTEAIVRLSMMGYKITEFPITVFERVYGKSMYSFKSTISYPIKTLLLTLVAAIDVIITRRVK